MHLKGRFLYSFLGWEGGLENFLNLPANRKERLSNDQVLNVLNNKNTIEVLNSEQFLA